MAKTSDNNEQLKPHKRSESCSSSSTSDGSTSSDDSASESSGNSSSSQSSADATKRSAKQISGRKPQNCRHCNKQYLNSGGLWKHEKRCQKNDNAKASKNAAGSFTCQVCNQGFRYQTGLTRHEKRHQGEGGFGCKQCGAKFRTDAERNVHKEEHHRTIKCQLCEMKFETDEEFFKHINAMHEGRDREYTICSDCGQQFRTNVQLKYHMESKCGTMKQWICNECNSRFMTKSTLRAHKLIHEGHKKHLCNFCGNSFLSKGQLKVHERSHTGEKPFVCDVCNKGFAYRESLVTHSSLHTGIKPYLCEGCGLRFSCIGNLIKHRKARPDTCGLPQYSTNTKIAPRASAKRTRARRPRGPYKKDHLILINDCFDDNNSDYKSNEPKQADIVPEKNLPSQSPLDMRNLETNSFSQVSKNLETNSFSQLSKNLETNSFSQLSKNLETNSFSQVSKEALPEPTLPYNAQFPNNLPPPGYGFNVGPVIYPPNEWPNYPIFQGQASNNSYTIYDQYNASNQQPSVIMGPQNFSVAKPQVDEIKPEPAIKPEFPCDAVVNGNTSEKEDLEQDDDKQLCLEQLVKIKLEEEDASSLVADGDKEGKDKKKRKHKHKKHKKHKRKEKRIPPKRKRKTVAPEESTEKVLADVAEIEKAALDDRLNKSIGDETEVEESSGSDWEATVVKPKKRKVITTRKSRGKIDNHKKWRKQVYTTTDNESESEAEIMKPKRRRRMVSKKAARTSKRKVKEQIEYSKGDDLEEVKLELKLESDSDNGYDYGLEVNGRDDMSDLEKEDEDLTMPPDLQYPTESKSGRPLFSCKFCMKEYSYLSALAKHEKSHDGLGGVVPEQKRNKVPKNKHNKETFNCKFCFKKYLNLSVLVKHEKDHGPEGKLLVRCSCCRKYFETKEQCLAHQARVHHEKLACRDCNKIFKEPDNLAAHVKYAHSGGSLKKYVYMCPTCGKNFTSKLALGDHEKSDCGRHPIHVCDVCAKTYTSAASLKTHMTVHSGVLPHLCNYCGKAFRTQGQVKVHERSHSGEKPFKCEFCPKAFAYRESLITHRSLHTGIKKHLCHGCGSRFSCISNLQAHRKSHKTTCGLEPKNPNIPLSYNITEDLEEYPISGSS